MNPLRSLRLLQPRLLPVGRHPKGSHQSLHTASPSRAATTTATAVKDSAPQSVLSPSHSQASKPLESPLSLLPVGVLVRSYLIAALSSSPRLFTPSLRFLSLLSDSRSLILSPDRNPIVRFLLRKTLYAHFCAGETGEEIRENLTRLRGLGYRGVVLAYAREIVQGKEESFQAKGNEDELVAEKGLEIWKQGNLETVRLLEEGDFLAVKYESPVWDLFTGSAPQILQQLAKGLPPTDSFDDAMTEICDLAKRRGSSPKTLARRLSIARDEGFVLGVKLVRGAYMGSDSRYIWSTKEETDQTYNGIAKALLRRDFNDTLKPSEGSESAGFHEINLVLATHNHDSVKKAMAIQKQLTETGQMRTELAYGQLMGMADEISCKLIMAGHHSNRSGALQKLESGVPKVYKYLPWGTLSECMKYLVRRAEENRDAAQRTEEGRLALKQEMGRRLFRRRV